MRQRTSPYTEVPSRVHQPEELRNYSPSPSGLEKMKLKMKKCPAWRQGHSLPRLREGVAGEVGKNMEYVLARRARL